MNRLVVGDETPLPSRRPNIFFCEREPLVLQPRQQHELESYWLFIHANMVRIKNRYLLVNILYPELDAGIPKATPDILAINSPTTNALTSQTLLKGIRAQVAELFGDYGSGAVSDSLMGKFNLFSIVELY